MVDLTPAPASLNIASPALGPWFSHASDPMPILPAPAGDLSVSITLSANMAWRAPAGATRSYFVATGTRPAGLRKLRAESGAAAFADGALVVLLTLLPEVETRLWTLTQPIPAPDGTAAPPANTPARPRVRYVALEVTAGTISDIERIRPADFPAELSSDADKAAFVGLSTDGGLSNAAQPTSELLRVGSDDAIAVENRTGAPLAAKLWCFDYRGRPLDPGAVANWWAFMASTGIWDNLWEDGTAQAIAPPAGGVQTLPTCPVNAGRTIHIANAHEGPIAAGLLARLNLTDLTAVVGASALYTVGAAPAIAMTATPNPDDAPLPRLAVLPLGNYGDPATATPFAGWTGGGFPATITRDFARVAVLDLERHIVGLDRTDAAQADARRRISPARNTAANPVLATADAVTGAIMTALAAGGSAACMAPVMDRLWGQTTPAGFGADPLPDTLDFEVLPLAGEGSTSPGGSAADQVVLAHFPAGALPANGWVRLWSHGLDTETGLRFRQDGGAGQADAAGEAFVVLPIPDGAAAPTDPNADPVRLSFDALVSTNGTSRYFFEERYPRPATVAGARLALAAPPTAPAGVDLWIAEQGAVMARGGGQYRSGQHVVALSTGGGDHALVDLTTLDATDMAAATLPNAAQAGDTLIVTEPAFGQTPDGDLAAGPNGAALVKRTRDGLNDVAMMGRPAPSQERREVFALERTGNTAVIGAVPGRAAFHENPPIQMGHPGVPAAEEVHGPGVALAGPVTDQLVPLMRERQATDLAGFLGAAGTPIPPTADPGGVTTWAAALETTTHGVVGDGIVRAYLAATSFTPGQSWVTTKNQIEAATGQDIDALIDTAGFDDDTLALAVDRMILKTRDGARSFANSVLDAIGRAEDFLYVETPAIDPHAANGGAIDLVGAITARWGQRPDLRVLLCVPERFLPNQTAKLEEVRRAGVSAALKSLQQVGGDRMALFAPVAGPGRRAHMAATTVVVDDALLLTGTAHLWRRGLTFDSSLAVGLFDEAVAFGRPAAVRAARLQLLANALGLPANFVPEDIDDCLFAVQRLAAVGGLGRINAAAYPPADDPTSATDRDIWNPDGAAGFTSDWLLFFAALAGGAATDFNNAIR